MKQEGLAEEEIRSDTQAVDWCDILKQTWPNTTWVHMLENNTNSSSAHSILDEQRQQHVVAEAVFRQTLNTRHNPQELSETEEA